MNKKKQLIYYIAVIGAFVTTQAPFWVSRKATAAVATTAKKTTGKKRATATTKIAAKKRVAAKQPKPYKVTSCSKSTFDEQRKVLVWEQAEGMTLELPVKVQKFRGNPMNYVAKLPKRKNVLCGLPVPKKGEKLDLKPGQAQQCGLVIDETRLQEASITMPEKLESLKPTVAKASTK